MKLGPNAKVPKTAFKPGGTPWNKGVKGYRNHKNSELKFDRNNPVFRESLRPAVRDCGVYGIINRNDRRIYIGSSGRLGFRLVRYRLDFSKGQDLSRPINRAIASDPEAFEFFIIENTASREEAFDRENFWIKFYRSNLPEFGYNACPTSRTCAGLKKTPEQIAAHVAMMTGRKRKPLTEEQKQRMSIARQGIRLSPEATAKGVATRAARKVNWQKVAQLDGNGEVIRIHEQVRIAARAIGFPKSFSNISAVCNGRRELAFGFRWKYA